VNSRSGHIVDMPEEFSSGSFSHLEPYQSRRDCPQPEATTTAGDEKVFRTVPIVPSPYRHY